MGNYSSKAMLCRCKILIMLTPLSSLNMWKNLQILLITIYWKRWRRVPVRIVFSYPTIWLIITPTEFCHSLRKLSARRFQKFVRRCRGSFFDRQRHLGFQCQSTRSWCITNRSIWTQTEWFILRPLGMQYWYRAEDPASFSRIRRNRKKSENRRQSFYGKQIPARRRDSGRESELGGKIASANLLAARKAVFKFLEEAKIASPVTRAPVSLKLEFFICGIGATKKFWLGFLFIKDESSEANK